MNVVIRERAAQIWEHKEYDGDGYFPISRKDAEDRMVDIFQHFLKEEKTRLLQGVVGEVEQAEIEDGHGSYREGEANMKGKLLAIIKAPLSQNEG